MKERTIVRPVVRRSSVKGSCGMGGADNLVAS
jgi:hypothetical protein